MKKLFFFLVAATVGISVSAQTAPTQKATDMKDLRKDLKEIRKDKKGLKQDIATGNGRGADIKKAEIKADRQEIKSDVKTLKQEGVKHPIKRAVHQIKHK